MGIPAKIYIKPTNVATNNTNNGYAPIINFVYAGNNGGLNKQNIKY
jgi:hypothetical protein